MGQLPGTCQAGGSGAYDGNLAVGPTTHRLFLILGLASSECVGLRERQLHLAISEESVQIADVEALIDLASIAGLLAWMCADSPASSRERISPAVDLEGLVELALGEECDKPLHVHSRWTRVSARSGSLFIDRERVRVRLRIGSINRFSVD